MYFGKSYSFSLRRLILKPEFFELPNKFEDFTLLYNFKYYNSLTNQTDSPLERKKLFTVYIVKAQELANFRI